MSLEGPKEIGGRVTEQGKVPRCLDALPVRFFPLLAEQ